MRKCRALAINDLVHTEVEHADRDVPTVGQLEPCRNRSHAHASAVENLRVRRDLPIQRTVLRKRLWIDHAIAVEVFSFFRREGTLAIEFATDAFAAVDFEDAVVIVLLKR